MQKLWEAKVKNVFLSSSDHISTHPIVLTTRPSWIENQVICDNNNHIYVGAGVVIGVPLEKCSAIKDRVSCDVVEWKTFRILENFRVLKINFEIIIGRFKNTIKYVDYPMNIAPLKSSLCLTWFMSLQWSGHPMHAFKSQSLYKLETHYTSIYIHVCSNWNDAYMT